MKFILLFILFFTSLAGFGQWVSQCHTCENAGVVADDGNSYTPSSASDMQNVANAGKTAYITNSFSVSGATFAANQIIVPNGGVLTGTGINLNGARFVLNNKQAFATTARFNTKYTECLTPELFGAASTTDDADAIEAMILNSDSGINMALSYQVNSQININDGIRTFKWSGNNSTIVSNYDPASTNNHVFIFNQIRMEICNLEIDGNDIADSAINIIDTDFYIENVHIHHFKGDEFTDVSYGIDLDYYSDTGRDIRIYNCEFNNFEVPDDGVIGNAGGSTRGIVVFVRDVATTGGIFDVQDSKFYSCYSEGDGVHIFPISDAIQDNELIWKFTNCQFWDNSRRDLKFQGGGLQAFGCTFTKISSESVWSDNTTVNVSMGLRDAVTSTQYHRNGIIKDCVFNYVEGDPMPIGAYLGLYGAYEALVEGNTFIRPEAHSYTAMLINGKNHNSIVRYNQFTNCGLALDQRDETSVGGIVEKNTFTYNKYTNGYGSGVIIIGGSNGAPGNIEFKNNNVDLNFDNSRNAFMGFIGSNSSWPNVDWTKLNVHDNYIKYSGTNNDGNIPVISVGSDFGPTNSFVDNHIMGRTATGAYQITGISSFTNTGNIYGDFTFPDISPPEPTPITITRPWMLKVNGKSVRLQLGTNRIN